MQYDLIMHELGNWESPMLRQVFKPQPALSPFIRDYCLLRKEWACDTADHWYILPDNSAYLIYYLAKKNGVLVSSLRLIGPRTRHIVINRRNRHLTFMVSFRPGGLSPFLKTPLSDLCDRAVDACELFSWANAELLEKLAIAARAKLLPEFIHILERTLLSNINTVHHVNPIIGEFARLTRTPQVSVSDIANDLGITERHLRNLSQKHIGHSPKSMLQIERFTRSLIITNQSREWASVAQNSGYYDQSHMIAEYQKMTGKSPERLFA